MITNPAGDKVTYLRNYNSEYTGFGSESTNNFKYEQYMFAVFWVTTCLTTMGQGGGDLMPQNNGERFFAIYLMIMNLSLYAYILGVISNLFMSADEAIVEKRAEISALENYLQSNNIPPELENEIRSSMNSEGGGADGVSLEEEKKVFQRLSHSLQVQVSKYTCSTLLDSVTAFSKCGEHFRENVCTELVEEGFSAGSYIVRRKEPCSSFFIIASGHVNILSMNDATGEEEAHMELTKGSVVGEIPFFFNMRHTESARVSMNGSSRMFVMTKAKYDRLLTLYPEEEEKVTQNILHTIDLNNGVGGKKKSGGSKSGSSIGGSSAASSDDNDKSSIGDSSVGSEGESDDFEEDDDGYGGDDDGASNAGTEVSIKKLTGHMSQALGPACERALGGA